MMQRQGRRTRRPRAPPRARSPQLRRHGRSLSGAAAAMLKGGGAVRPSFIQTIAGIPGHNIVSLPCSSNLATIADQLLSGHVGLCYQLHHDIPRRSRSLLRRRHGRSLWGAAAATLRLLGLPRPIRRIASPVDNRLANASARRRASR